MRKTEHSRNGSQAPEHRVLKRSAPQHGNKKPAEVKEGMQKNARPDIARLYQDGREHAADQKAVSDLQQRRTHVGADQKIGQMPESEERRVDQNGKNNALPAQDVHQQRLKQPAEEQFLHQSHAETVERKQPKKVCPPDMGSARQQGMKGKIADCHQETGKAPQQRAQRRLSVQRTPAPAQEKHGQEQRKGHRAGERLLQQAVGSRVGEQRERLAAQQKQRGAGKRKQQYNDDLFAVLFHSPPPTGSEIS